MAVLLGKKTRSDSKSRWCSNAEHAFQNGLGLQPKQSAHPHCTCYEKEPPSNDAVYNLAFHISHLQLTLTFDIDISRFTFDIDMSH